MNLLALTSKRAIALAVWGDQHGRPYIWGGDDPILGFDCSGLVLEGLKAAGVVPRDFDATAHTLLHAVFASKPRLHQPLDLRPGCLLFWEDKTGKIRHVEIVAAVVNGTVWTIGASGGGSKTPDAAAAAAQNAYVKVRPAAPGWTAGVDPFPLEGS